MITSGFFNSVNGDRIYDTIDISNLFTGLIGDGIFETVGRQFRVSQMDTPEMSIKVDTGKAWFNNTWTINDSAIVLPIETSSVVLGRIDTIVIEMSRNTEIRNNDVKVITGVPSADPQKIVLEHSEFVDQYPLSYIFVEAGTTQIAQINIENAIGTPECPFVIGIVDTMDVEVLTAQLKAQVDASVELLSTAIDETLYGNMVAQIALKQDVIEVRNTIPENTEGSDGDEVFVYSD